MIAFLDTAAVIKLYHVEAFSAALEEHLRSVERMIVSDLTSLEVVSASWRKARSTQTLDFSAADALLLQTAFLNDAARFRFTPLDEVVLSSAHELLRRCNELNFPLRTLDALQLASAITLGNYLDEFITFDRDLKSAARFCGLRVPDL